MMIKTTVLWGIWQASAFKVYSIMYAVYSQHVTVYCQRSSTQHSTLSFLTRNYIITKSDNSHKSFSSQAFAAKFWSVDSAKVSQNVRLQNKLYLTLECFSKNQFRFSSKRNEGRVHAKEKSNALVKRNVTVSCVAVKMRDDVLLSRLIPETDERQTDT